MNTDRNDSTSTSTIPTASAQPAGKWECNALVPPSRGQIKAINQAMRDLQSEHGSFIRRSGVRPNVNDCQMWKMCSGHRPEVTAAQIAVGNRFRWVLTKDNAEQVIAAMAQELVTLKASRPVEDESESPEANAERMKKSTQAKGEREEHERICAELWARLYGDGEITLQPGQMAITLALCFDDSDSQSDYFDRHASLSPDFVLAVVPKGSETEAKARAALAKVADLAGVAFEWKTEKYSMGHGNYLESEGHELADEIKETLTRAHYRGGKVTHGHWEVEFRSAYSSPMTLPRHKAFNATPAPAQPAAPGEAIGEGTLSRNEAKGGLEIRFPAKPAQPVIDSLKASGWRWSRFGSCWWIKASPAAEASARAILGQPVAA